jgi:hypothetical protein
MDGEETRQLLNDLPQQSLVPKPDGYKAIPCASVPEADRAEVEDWVREHGGQAATFPLPTDASLRRGKLLAATDGDSEAFLLVPLQALWPDG